MYNVCMLQRKEQLLTERLVLKSIDENDKKDLLEIINNPLVKKGYMIPDFASVEEEEKFFQKLRNYSLNKERFVFGIYSKNKIIGFLNDVHRENLTIEVGFFFAPKEWNKGYATEALKAAINELFRMGFEAVQAGHFEDNLASGRVMQKCGMKHIEKEEIVEYRNAKHRCVFYEIRK